jgi:uncharacterized protein (DUF736 family)
LHPTREGGWTGAVLLLTAHTKIKLVPNDNPASPRAPAFRVFAGDAELGAAWKNQTNETEAREYLGCEVELPGLRDPISFAIFLSDDKAKARAVWSPRKET